MYKCNLRIFKKRSKYDILEEKTKTANTSNSDKTVDDFLKYLDNSPSPYHAVDEIRKILRKSGYKELSEVFIFFLQIKIRNFDYQAKLCPKILRFSLKAKPWPNILVLSKIHILGKNSNFGQNFKFFCQKFKFWSKLNFWPKIRILAQNPILTSI